MPTATIVANREDEPQVAMSRLSADVLALKSRRSSHAQPSILTG